MKSILYFVSDHEIPTEDELQECINTKKVSDSIIVLKWYVRYNGWHELWFTEESKHWTVQDCIERMPKVYGL